MFYINVSLVSVIVALYVYSVLRYIYYWKKTIIWPLPDTFRPSTSISIIIAARNEEQHIQACINAIVAQNYPTELVEILVIDDHSEDNTPLLLHSYPTVQLLSLPKEKMGKKAAIQYGIEHSKHTLIVTTDADCTMSPQWLSYIASIYEKKQPKMIAAPVSFIDTNTLFEQFQSLDFMGMMGVAAAGVKGQFMNMCNGANLAYEREAFYTVRGFEGINHLASGDDMLLMEKIAQYYPQQIVYLKNSAAQTLTYPKRTVARFIQQRLRWATKSGSYKNWQTQATLANVWLLCWAQALLLIAALFNSPSSYLWLLFTFAFGSKMLVDYLFLKQMAIFFDRQGLLKSFVPAFFWHWWYIVYIGTASLFIKKYAWKNRAVR